MSQIDRVAPAPSLTDLNRALKTPFVPIPAGWFLMGSTTGQADERPLHRVWVEAFEMAVYPVTRAQYKEFLQSSKQQPLPRDWNNPLFTSPDQPIVRVLTADGIRHPKEKADFQLKRSGNVRHGVDIKFASIPGVIQYLTGCQ